jgi:AraC-like DNA-binding protein
VRVGDLLAHEPGGAERTRRHVRAIEQDLCKIDVLVHGTAVIEQDGRRAALAPGDLTFIDLTRPTRWVMSPMRVVAVVFPRALLPLRRDDAARLTAVPIRGDAGTGALVSSVARQLAGNLDEPNPAHGVRLGTGVLDMLAVAMAGRLGRTRELPPDTAQRALLRRIRTFIEVQLGDPTLSPGVIAAAHHISVRQLYNLFALEETTVSRWIQQRRLERCRRDLASAPSAEQTVSAIAARWGLTNAAHFSRLFRAAYGVPPSEYRQLNR